VSEQFELTAAQRAAGVDRLAENIALLSGAGCGKTFVLARRFVELLTACGDKEDPLSRFVALTFTDKAALEMADRVRRMLASFAAEHTGRQRKQILRWIDELSDARIATIHAFCASLLRAHAVDAGIDPNFAVCADELLTEKLIADATEQALLHAVEDEGSPAAELLASEPFGRATAMVRRMVIDRATFATDDYLDPRQTLERWRKQQEIDLLAAWEQLTGCDELRRELSDVAAIPCGDPADKLAIVRDELLPLVRELLESPSPPSPEVLRQIAGPKGGIGSAKAWGDKATTKDVRDRLKEIANTITAMAVYAEPLGEPDARAANALAALASLSADAAARYAAEKRARGILDFTDLLDLTYRLLAADPAAAKALRAGVDQLLVDEAQDTDALQIRLLERLIFGKENVDRPPPGKLFIVGDGKQSIYRFRGARPEMFDDLCNRLGPDNREQLDTSFRAHAGGVAFINHLFAPLMGADYAPIRAHRRQAPPHPCVEIVLALDTGGARPEKADDAVRAQAAACAERIAEILEHKQRLVWDEAANRWRPAQARDVAVLLWRMTHSLKFEREFVNRGIPYYVVGGTGLFRRQEVFDVLNALRVIDNPFDDVALFGMLRGGMFGLDDNVLMHVAECCQPPYFHKLLAAAEEESTNFTKGNGSGISEKVGEYLADNLDGQQFETLGAAVRLTRDLHARKDALGPDGLIEAVLASTGYEAVLLTQFHGTRMVGNVRRVVELARDAAAGQLALADFIAQMDELTIEESRFEQAAVAGEAEDVVRIMSIHKAKGLEFPVVVLPDLNAGNRAGGGPLLSRTDWGWTYDLKAEEEAGELDSREPDAPVSFQLAKLAERRDQDAEDVRKLYVAATRARDHLIFVGADRRTKDGLTFRDSDSYLAKLDRVLGLREAADDKRDSIPYGDDGEYSAALRTVTPADAPVRRRKTAGDKLLAKAESPRRLADGIVGLAGRCEGGEKPPLIGPLPLTAGRAELAVTALGEFEHCPMRYRWGYELRLPRAPAGPAAAPNAAGSLDAATLGTLYHRCMELLDFARPQDAGDLVRQAAGEMDLTAHGDLPRICAEFADMLGTCQASPLWGQLAAAEKRFAELDFILDAGPVSLRGQIDLLYQDNGGAWHIVDYKSDRLEDDEDVAEHARRYELQMLTYAVAAGRHLGCDPADAQLYFLRTGRTHTLAISPDAIRSAGERIEGLAMELILARRSGRFERRSSRACETCPYGKLCGTAAAAE